MNLPPAFVKTINNTFGERGRRFLAELPDRVDSACSRWDLSDVRPVENLSYNFVAFAMRGGTPVVLKLGVPHSELLSEMAALRLYDGRGAVRLLESDPEDWAMLLERILPGTRLTQVVDEDDERATGIAADVMRQIWRPAPEGDQPFITAEYWAEALPRTRKRFEGGTGPFPPELFERAEALFAELLPSQTRRVVLHGDLHHENILQSSRGWLAIDPKGVIGEPEYEVGALLRNPLDLLGRPDPVRLTERRIAILCERLGFERRRVRDWAVAQAVLSACWNIEDNTGNAAYDIGCAEIYNKARI